jgi:hypothetical protein
MQRARREPHFRRAGIDDPVILAHAMNDLAELALRGLDTARKRVARYPLTALSAAGFATACTVEYVGGRVGAAPATTPVTGWFGLLPDRDLGNDRLPGAVLFGGVVLLLLLWLLALNVLRRPGYGDRHAWRLAGIWGAPFVLGPPLLSADVYAYAASGLLARDGLDPYVHGPAALGSLRIVGAVDPTWRTAPSTSGPLGLLVQQLAVTVSGGSALGAVIALRVLTVAAVIAIGLLAADLAGPRRVMALALTVLNPATLLLIVSGAHLEGLLVALLLGALVASSQRRWLLAVVLASAAAGVKPVAIIAVLAVIIAHSVGQRARVAWRIAAHDVVVGAAALTVCAFAVGKGMGWTHNLSSLTREHTPFSPASIVANAISPVVPSASFDDLAVGGRIAAALAGLTIIAYLFSTVGMRPLDRTVGYALLTAGLCAPVLFPWYLLWGVLCLAATALNSRLAWVVALSCAACVLHPAGLPADVARTVTTVALVVIALVLLPVLAVAHTRGRAVTGRLSARG